LLAVVVTAAAIGIATIAAGGLSRAALTYSAIGAAVCWTAGALALAATYLGNQCKLPVQGMLLGMFFRMGLPLIALLALPSMGGPLATRGAGITILGVYLVALVVETLLSLRMVPAAAAKTA
jgi:hypothetical protein